MKSLRSPFYRIILLGLLLPVTQLHSAEIRVTNLNDRGSGSLRQAVAVAADGDTILLRATGSIELKTPIEINRSITIRGQEGPLRHAIEGTRGTHLLTVAAGRAVKLERLTLQGGVSKGNGGAVLSSGELTLSYVKVANNSAAGSGGGIYQSGGRLLIEQSWLQGNEARLGGAIAIEAGPLEIRSSGFFANAALEDGGAVWADGSGLQILSTSFGGNQAQGSGGALFGDNGNMRFINLTLVDNTSEPAAQIWIGSSANAQIGNTLLSGTGGYAGITGTGSITSLGHNLSDGPSAHWATASDLYDTAIGLGEMVHFGGLSPVYPILPDSAAVDAGNNALVSGADQRGLSRFSDGNGDFNGAQVDIGAFEIQQYVVSSLQLIGSATGAEDDEGFGNPFDPSDDADSISSADAFAQLTAVGRADIGDAMGANNAAGGGVVVFAPAILPGVTTLKGRQLFVRRDVTILGPEAGQLTIDGDTRSRIFVVREGANLHLSGVTLTKGAAHSGAGILVEAHSAALVEAVNFSGNSASGVGGAVALEAETRFIANRSSFIGNRAGSDGGAVHAQSATQVGISTSTLSGNFAAMNGGALAAAGDLWLEGSTLVANSANHEGAALRVFEDGTAYVRNSIFSHGETPAFSVTPAARILSAGANLSSSQDVFLDGPGDRIGIDPQLSELGLQGGTTPAYAPLPGGPAINSGDTSEVGLLDQPGLPRVRGGVVDIGSVEFQNDPPVISSNSAIFADCVGGGAQVTVAVEVSDPDGDALTVSWIVDDQLVASESLSGNTTSPVEVSQLLQLPLGYTLVTIQVEDVNFLRSSCVVAVIVVDGTPPVLTLIGDPLVQLECGETYIDEGATVRDGCDVGLTQWLTSHNLPDGPLATGNYYIDYSAVDSSGNSTTVRRSILVTDTVAPEVTLNGPASLVLECGIDTWEDAGAVAIDGCAGPLEVSRAIFADGGVEVATIETRLPGFYRVVYTATDPSGNSAFAVQEVEIRDTIAPVVTPPDSMIALTEPGFCSASLNFAATATDNSIAEPTLSYLILPNDAYPDGLAITAPFAFAPGAHTIEVRATDASGNIGYATFTVTVSDPFLNCVNNTSWPNALPLPLEPVEDTNLSSAQQQQFLASTNQSRWYRFNVVPGSRVTVTLTNLPANYDLVVYRDIAAEYARLLNQFNSPDPRQQELALLGAEFAPESFSPESFSPESFSPESFSPESFSPESFSPESFSPESFSPESFSPESFSPESFSPESFSPESFSPESFSPESFSPESFSPESFSPESFSPESFSSAQMASMVAFSAFSGLAGEGVAFNTFTRSGEFYVRVRGANGVFSTEMPFSVTVQVDAEICMGLQGPETFGESTLFADAGDYRTLIVWDSSRNVGTEAELSALQNVIFDLALRPEVAGAVIDVSQESRVLAANVQADAMPGCPYAKNLVAQEIKALIEAWRHLNPEVRYLVLLGNDEAIPFFRSTDQALLANEANYVPPVRDNTHSQSSLRYGQILTQDPYATNCSVNLVTGPFPYPSLAIGRLIESASEIQFQIEQYLSSAAGELPVPSSALVTGYDFLDDGAHAVVAEWEAGLGAPVSTLISASTLSPAESWTATDLAEALFNGRHDLVYLAGHFSTGSTLAADYRTRLTAAELLASGANYLNSLVFSAGCHSGYNTVDAHAVTSITRQPDWAQVFARLGAIYIAGTGYQYGDTEFVEYGERLYRELAQQLRTGEGPVSIGDALVAAKRTYLIETPLMRGIHEKTLLQVTLYGLPMLKLDLPGARLPVSGPSAPSGIAPVAIDRNPGQFLGLATAELKISPELTPRSLDLLNIDDGSTVTARWFEGRNGSFSNPAEPVRPLEIVPLGVPGTLLRGTGFRGGRYLDTDGFLPLTGAPATEIRGVYGNFFSEVFYPVQPYAVNHLAALCDGSDGQSILNVFPAQFLASGGGALGGTMRTYSEMDFRLFYSNNRETYSATGTPSIPALASAPTIAVVVSELNATDDAVEFEISVTGNPAAGIQATWITYTGLVGSPFHGEWRSLDLTQSTVNSTLWTGSLPLNGGDPADLRFIVQAVSGTGLVALNSNRGFYYQIGPVELAVQVPTQTELLDAPTDGAYGESLILEARVLDVQTGEPLAGKRVAFRVGVVQTTASTGIDGIARAQLALTSRPGIQQLQASFTGDSTHAASVAASQLEVLKQSTHLIFQPLPDRPTGADLIVALSDGSGKPLRERTVFFLLDFGDQQVGEAVITNFAGQADLSTVELPTGSVSVTAYFNGNIPVPGTEPVFINDDLYQPTSASISLVLNDPVDLNSLLFTPTKVDVNYGTRSGGKHIYTQATVAGTILINLPLRPADLLAGPLEGNITATIEARLAGQIIASESLALDVRGENGSTWNTGNRVGKEVAEIDIHWDNPATLTEPLSATSPLFTGRLTLRLKAQPDTSAPASDALPNLLEVRVILGDGSGETIVQSFIQIGDGIGAVPWSRQTPNLKEFRP